MHVAHRAREIGNVRLTQRTYLYELIDKSNEIVQLLCGALPGSSEDFEGWVNPRRFISTGRVYELFCVRNG